MAAKETPSITVTLCLTPSSFPLNKDSLPELSIKATLHATQPITIFTWPSIFNTELALCRGNFFAEDTKTGEPVNLDYVRKKRGAYNHRRGSFDDKHHVTLHPGVPLVVTDSFTPLLRTDYYEKTPLFKPGHQYRFGVAKYLDRRGVEKGEEIRGDLWWWGTRDDVLIPEYGPWDFAKHLEGGVPIKLEPEPIVFTVEESKDDVEHGQK